MSADGIALIDLYGYGVWVFQFFHREDETVDRANWEPQHVTIGTMPLFYANRDPQRITINDVLLDSSETGESLTKDIEELRALMAETDQGTPPPLLYICGDWQQRVVLEELSVKRESFSSDGRLLRARLNLTLLEIQRPRESVTSRIVETEAGDFNPLGNF